MFKKTLIAIATLMSPYCFSATCAQNNNELTGLIGLDGQSGRVYVRVESQTKECSCSEFRFMPGDTDTDKALSILLSAKMAEKKVRIDILEAGNCNSAFRVYVQ